MKKKYHSHKRYGYGRKIRKQNERKILLIAIFSCIVVGLGVSITVAGIPKLLDGIFFNIQKRIFTPDVIKRGTAVMRDTKLSKKYEEMWRQKTDGDFKKEYERMLENQRSEKEVEDLERSLERIR